MGFATLALGGLTLVTAALPVAGPIEVRRDLQSLQAPPLHAGRYNLDTGGLDANPAPAPPGNPVVYSNTSAAGTVFLPGPGTFSMDWSLLNAAPLNEITDIQIAYGTSSAVPVTIGVRIHAGATGFGVQGVEAIDFTLPGLPGSAGGGLEAFIIDVDLGAAAFVLPEGPFGYSYEFFDTVTGPFIPLPPSDPNVVDAFDQYTSAGTYIGTFAFGPAAFSSFHLELKGAEPPECFLVIGDAPGAGPFQWGDDGYAFTTQVDHVSQSYPVLMEALPAFVLPGQVTSRATVVSPAGTTGAWDDDVGQLAATPTGSLLPWEFTVQVLMWNPQVFPSLPEQYTHGLAVQVLPSGRVITAPYGTSQGGMGLWAEVFVNDAGQQAIRFPFDIPLL